MTKFYVEDILVEKLKEENLNVAVLLQIHAKKQKKKAVIEYNVSDEDIIHAKGQYGIDIEAEILAAIQKDIYMHGEEFEVKVIRRK